ncbi:LysR family transcriptional regulator [Spirulina sp. CS-785/01]|uniref:LysR family transcriptional regulator n=1 Tax=Spirulina sp. CS-785/01 TaxID=3021716 RepID=UPI00233044BA|nr:LysR family transcriptional regulator [Spirulina sp. CS-785/01]MDB9314081.1 LysR family transcriptional regulator [Spirulina sp. CS-785/01]
MGEINLNRLKLSQLRALIAVDEAKNFSEAALQLEVSQSAISHAIAQLEEELGVSLFSRGRQGAVPTPVGQRIINHSRRIVDLLIEITEEAKQARGLNGGTVRIASFRSVSTHVLSVVIAQFRSQYPNIEVAITEHFDYFGVEQALQQGHADLGFTYLPTSSEFTSWEILHDDYIALLPPDAPPCHEPLTWQQLAQYPLITTRRGDACYASLNRYLRKAPVPLNIAYEVREDSTIVSMVTQGLGAAIMPRLSAEPVPPQIQVAQLPASLERVIGVALLANALYPPSVYAFLEVIKQMNVEHLITRKLSKTVNSKQ